MSEALAPHSNLDADAKEVARLLANRHYFESGCRCIHDGKLSKVPAETGHAQALEHYEAHCKCSRNYTPPIGVA